MGFPLPSSSKPVDAIAKAFREADHPRGPDGKWTSIGGNASAGGAKAGPGKSSGKDKPENFTPAQAELLRRARRVEVKYKGAEKTQLGMAGGYEAAKQLEARGFGRVNGRVTGGYPVFELSEAGREWADEQQRIKDQMKFEREREYEADGHM